MLRAICAAVALGLAVGSCAATSKAGTRRMAEAHLRWCRRDADAAAALRCYEETKAFCLKRGLEKTCGEGR